MNDIEQIQQGIIRYGFQPCFRPIWNVYKYEYLIANGSSVDQFLFEQGLITELERRECYITAEYVIGKRHVGPIYRLHLHRCCLYGIEGYEYEHVNRCTVSGVIQIIHEEPACIHYFNYYQNIISGDLLSICDI